MLEDDVRSKVGCAVKQSSSVSRWSYLSAVWQNRKGVRATGGGATSGLRFGAERAFGTRQPGPA